MWRAYAGVDIEGTGSCEKNGKLGPAKSIDMSSLGQGSVSTVTALAVQRDSNTWNSQHVCQTAPHISSVLIKMQIICNAAFTQIRISGANQMEK